MAINDKLLKGAAGGGGGGGLVPSANFQTVLYTGNGENERTIILPFAADFVWLKRRDAAFSHHLVDTVRGGTNPMKTIFSNGTNAEFTSASQFNNYGYIKSLSSTNLVLVKGSQSGSNTNTLNSNYVLYCWKAPDAFSHSASGSQLASSGKSNQAAGFSIVSYTGNDTSGATVKHNLGVKPQLILFKAVGANNNWGVYNETITANKFLVLNATSQAVDSTTPFNDTEPTDTIMTLGSSGSFNRSGTGGMIAYCFTSKTGISKVGSYTGNNSTIGNHIECGFEPGWVMIKQTSAAGTRWVILDNKRNTTNARNTFLFADGNFAEGTEGSLSLNFTTTGFQYYSTTGAVNASMNASQTYIFYAIAADPDTTSPVVAKSFNVEQYEGNGASQRIGSVNTLFTKYAVFNGSNSIIQTPTIIPANNFSFSCWVNVRNLPGSGSYQIIYNTNVSRRWYLSIFDGGKIQAWNGAAEFSTTSNVITRGQWHNIIYTANSSTGKKIYVDGAEVFTTSDTVDNTVPDGSNAWKGFGKFYNDTLYFNGKLDQVRIYNTKLNQAAVTQLYNETQASSSTLNFPTGLGCLALYEFNDDATSTSSSAYNGSPSNITFDSFLFKPDLSIIRNMDSGDPWGWFDTQRGVLERIQSSSNAAEASLANSLTEFNNGGFTVGNEESVNTNNETYTSYNFKMLDNNNNAPVQFAAGANSASRSSLVSANPSAGMSIVLLDKPNTNTDTYNHGLSAVPTFIILKKLNATDDMYLYTPTTGNTSRLSFNNTNGVIGGSGVWGGTTPTASLFTLQNQSGGAHVAYCFHSSSQFSSFGTYNGNSGTQTIATGFQPDFLMVKGTHASGWRVLDSKRVSGAKKNSLEFQDAGSGQQTAYASVTFLSTGGFRFDNFSNADFNATNRSYIYWAMKIN